MYTRRKDARNRCRILRRFSSTPGILRDAERCPVRVFKEMNGAPKSR